LYVNDKYIYMCIEESAAIHATAIKTVTCLGMDNHVTSYSKQPRDQMSDLLI